MEFFVNKKSVSQIADLRQKIGVALTFLKSFLFFFFFPKTSLLFLHKYSLRHCQPLVNFQNSEKAFSDYIMFCQLFWKSERTFPTFLHRIYQLVSFWICCELVKLHSDWEPVSLGQWDQLNTDWPWLQKHSMLQRSLKDKSAFNFSTS